MKSKTRLHLFIGGIVRVNHAAARFLIPCVLLLCAIQSLYPQTTLTGAVWFGSSPTGGTSVQQGYIDGALNTLGGDPWWDLWMALNPDGTSPVNGPSDTQAAISIPLTAGNTYTYYLFGQGPCCPLNYTGLNLFFDGNGSSPGISVFGVLNSPDYLPNGNPSTFSLPVGIAPGSGTGFYTAGGLTVVLTGYDWSSSGALDVCQAFSFTPGTAPSATGSVTLQAFPAATLSSSNSSAAPRTNLTFTGSGFAPLEKIKLHVRSLTEFPIATTNADTHGAFTMSARLPPEPYGPEDVYAVGEQSGYLGATSIYFTPLLLINPHRGSPGGSATIQGVGFGAGEAVDVSWGNPRQFLGTAFADGSGSFAGSAGLKITIPTNAPPGRNAVVATGQTTRAVTIGSIFVQ